MSFQPRSPARAPQSLAGALAAAAALALAALAGAPARAGAPIDFVITLDDDQEVSGGVSAGTGSGTASLDPGTLLLSWSIDYTDLTGPLTVAHFHGPAALCESAPPLVTISGPAPASGNLAGSSVISSQQAADLQAGLWYVNLHTSLNPSGEIRGQVVPGPLGDPVPSPVPEGGVHVRLESVADGLTAPNWGTAAPGDPDRLFVTDQNGILWAIELATGTKSVFLDVSAMIVPLGVFGPGSFDERGLLGVAFHPGYQANGLLYTFTSEPVRGPADFSTIPDGGTADCQSVIREWQVPDPGDPGSVVDPGSTRVLLTIDKPQFNHNAGGVAFGPDGMLYISVGDGGGADDKDGQVFIGGAPITGHGCIGNGQDTTNPLGDLLRIDPLGNNSANGQYGIPADNPFVGQAGFLGEIWAYGFRNPFRFSFDTATGDLYAGDVGQNDIEEIDVVTAGGNYGWNVKEGTFAFVASGNDPGYVTDAALALPAGLVDPIAQYDHGEGLAVIGGFVYRGAKIPALEGRYVFGEFARTFASNGRLFYLGDGNEVLEFALLGQKELGAALLGMGQDASGELYAMVNATMFPSGSTGLVLRIAPKLGDLDGDGITGIVDLLALLAAWGQARGAADLDGSGVVGVVDLLVLLASWG